MSHQSIIEARGAVVFPEFTQERIYMEAFTQSEGLPEQYARWQKTVDDMLYGIEAPGPIYLMVHQKLVSAGNTHRRPGLHIDGYWFPEVKSHGGGGGGGGGHGGYTPRHGGIQKPGKIGTTPPVRGPAKSWSDADFSAPEGIIIASTLTATRGLIGTYDGVFGEGGDCSHIAVDHLDSFMMEAGTVYASNVTGLHETLPVLEDCARTVVRLNVPGWTPR